MRGKGHTISALESLMALWRVIFALILRDIRTRWGSTPAYVVTFLFPLVHILVLVAMWVVLGRISPYGESNILWFSVSMIPFITFSYVSRFLIIHVIHNKVVLAFPIFKITDILFSGLILEIFNVCVVVMILCAGSRTDELKYCSRTCCGQALKNAVTLKERQPDTDIVILYRDIRTYGFAEKLYKEARAKGIRFVPYTPENKPVVARDGDGLRCDIYEPGLKKIITSKPELVVLAPGTVPADSARALGLLLKVPVNEDGFFVETHAKLGPIDFPAQGIYLCGGAHSPKSIDEAICQAQGAVARAATVLSRDNLMAGGVVAAVDQERCAACLTCLRICPYGVPAIDGTGKAAIEPVQCHGCGSCAGECPNKAIQLQHYKDHQVLEKIRSLFREVPT